MTKLLIKLFIVLSQYGFIANEDKENDKRVRFHKTIGKATAEIVVDVVENKDMLLIFYDLKNQKYIIVDSVEAFDCEEVHWAFRISISLAKAAISKEKVTPKEKEKSLFEELSDLNECKVK